MKSQMIRCKTIGQRNMNGGKKHHLKVLKQNNITCIIIVAKEIVFENNNII